MSARCGTWCLVLLHKAILWTSLAVSLCDTSPRSGARPRRAPPCGCMDSRPDCLQRHMEVFTSCGAPPESGRLASNRQWQSSQAWNCQRRR